MAINNAKNSLKSRIVDGDLKKFHDVVIGNSYVTYVHHDFILSQNLQDDLICSTIDKPSQFYTSLPLPASISKTKNTYDTGLSNVIEKEKWKLKIKTMKSAYKHVSQKRKLTKINTRSSKATIPLYLLKFAKLLLEDPDPFFDSDYNWYFSGSGNLCPININGSINLIKSAGNTVYLNKINDDNCDEELCKYSFRNNDLIYETLIADDNKSNVIGLRLKFNIYLLKVDDSNEKLELKVIANVKAASPISSFTIDQYLNVYYACVDGGIYYYEVEANAIQELRPIFKDKKINYWSSLHLLYDNDLLQTTSNELIVYDKRKEYSIDESKDLTNSMNCERITTSKLDKSNYLYIGSTHSIQLYDLRLCNQNRFNFVKKWTHGLQTPPLFIQIETLNECDLICLSNQNIKDICFILNPRNYKNIETKYSPNCIQKISQNILIDWNDNFQPWHPPTIFDTLNMAQKRGFCLDPTVNLSKRFNTSRTGNVFLMHDNDYSLITLNSLGETFHQKISPYSIFTDEDSVSKSLQSWTEQIPTTSLFSATEEINLSHYYNIIRYRRPLKIGRDRIKKSLLSNVTWKNKLKYMFECTDFCAHEFLSAWELSNEDLGMKSLVPPPPDTTFNVKSWLSGFNDF